MRVRQILFGTDFSPASEAARRVAVDMAREAGATLHVVHVVPSVTDPSLPAEQLTELAKAVDGGLRVTTALLDGSAGGEIVRYAQEQQIDLIVVGTHGRTGFSRALLGSVAESVVRLAPCLVLSVPAALFEKAAVPADVEAVPSTSRLRDVSDPHPRRGPAPEAGGGAARAPGLAGMSERRPRSSGRGGRHDGR
jgi:nucleotide-binding universal stress UspA family protein